MRRCHSACLVQQGGSLASLPEHMTAGLDGNLEPASVLPKAYKPSHAENRMRGEGDVLKARADYAQRQSANLHLLLRSRFEWMNQYVRPDSLGDLNVGIHGTMNLAKHPDSVKAKDLQWFR